MTDSSQIVRTPGGDPASPGTVSRITGMPCAQCGHVHVRCGGHKTNRPLEMCTYPPIPGGDICKHHGGSNPGYRANVERRVAWEAAQGQVAELLRECDLPEQHPIDGLLEVVRHSGAMMRMLGYIVAGLEATDEDGKPVPVEELELGEGKVLVAKPNNLIGFNHDGDQAQNIYVRMYGEWSDRYSRACKLALDANIDERLVRNAEATTGVFLEAFEAALKEAELDPDQARRFSAALATRLRKVAGPLPR